MGEALTLLGLDEQVIWTTSPTRHWAMAGWGVWRLVSWNRCRR